MLFEGGQMPLFRRLPKRGFSNRNFVRSYAIVNVNQLERFEDGTAVDAERLSRAGLIDDAASRVKILGNGDLTKRLEVSANKFSKTAEYKITASGGTAKVI
jgi:large subunit ribosomal protein L15